MNDKNYPYHKKHHPIHLHNNHHSNNPYPNHNPSNKDCQSDSYIVPLSNYPLPPPSSKLPSSTSSSNLPSNTQSNNFLSLPPLTNSKLPSNDYFSTSNNNYNLPLIKIYPTPSSNDDKSNNYPVPSSDNYRHPLVPPSSNNDQSLLPLNKTLTLSFQNNINLPPISNSLSSNNFRESNYPSNNNYQVKSYPPPSSSYYHHLHNDYYQNNYPTSSNNYYPPSSNNYKNDDYRPIYNNYRNMRYLPYYYNSQYGQMYSFRPYQFNTTPRAYHRRHVESEPYDQNLQYATEDKIKATLAPTDSGIPELKYKLEVIQQPIRARMCGFGERDRRPISPLPFLRLKISDENGPVDIHKIDPGFLVVQASLFEETTNREAMLVVHPSSMPGNPQCVDNLVGEKTAHGKRLHDTQGIEDIWFVFRDLSVRAEGTFYMKFTLIHVGWQGHINMNTSPSRVLETVCSDAFIVYTAKRFPGMIETTRLAYCFVRQGNKIPTRRDPTKQFSEEVDDHTRQGSVMRF